MSLHTRIKTLIGLAAVLAFTLLTSPVHATYSRHEGEGISHRTEQKSESADDGYTGYMKTRMHAMKETHHDSMTALRMKVFADKHDDSKTWEAYKDAYPETQKDKDHDKNSDGDGTYMRHAKHVLHAWMTGEQEVPKTGDPDGRGWAAVLALPEKGLVCTVMKVDRIDPATAAHIHKAPKGVAGPVVVTLPTPDDKGFAKGCVGAEESLVKAIKDHPEEYYVNVHNAPYPDGALRGQLYR